MKLHKMYFNQYDNYEMELTNIQGCGWLFHPDLGIW